ncbi:uncharacterized protein BXZ73DRAFT_101427 [Epithele typhae]|uniref:uncharacterized protein n=1 Tax=Epithele typhae TaxID=378194 RepID=UPI0020081580|nr:uncharacterized protein BXZ73DRAFT_101427 [Epithele typhae]KAH9932052.1 hypothetical protein BXZ73DRAFT_101427 [Epithele typhae]
MLPLSIFTQPPVHVWVVPGRNITAGGPILEDLGILTGSSTLWAANFLPVGQVDWFWRHRNRTQS